MVPYLGLKNMNVTVLHRAILKPFSAFLLLLVVGCDSNKGNRDRMSPDSRFNDSMKTPFSNADTVAKRENEEGKIVTNNPKEIFEAIKKGVPPDRIVVRDPDKKEVRTKTIQVTPQKFYRPEGDVVILGVWDGVTFTPVEPAEVIDVSKGLRSALKYPMLIFPTDKPIRRTVVGDNGRLFERIYDPATRTIKEVEIKKK